MSVNRCTAQFSSAQLSSVQLTSARFNSAQLSSTHISALIAFAAVRVCSFFSMRQNLPAKCSSSRRKEPLRAPSCEQEAGGCYTARRAETDRLPTKGQKMQNLSILCQKCLSHDVIKIVPFNTSA